MTEGGTDLRILKPKDSNEISTDVRGTKRKLDITRDIEEDVEIERFEHPCAPKRRRRSKEGVVGIVKKSITRVYEYVNTLLFGSTEEDDNPIIHSESVQTEVLQDQAVDMTQPGYKNPVNFKNISEGKENIEKCENESGQVGRVTELLAVPRYLIRKISKKFNISNNDPKSSTPFERPKESNRHSCAFGLQASGPLTTKTEMADMKFCGRQFAISTQEKRDADRKNQHPTSILSKIRQQNISATSINSPYKPLSITERTFREDLARGVRRSKDGGGINKRIKTPFIKRGSILAAFREDEFLKYKAILESSPATGLKKASYRSQMALNDNLRTPTRFKDTSFTNRTSLFKHPNTSSAINITRYSRDCTISNNQRISCQTKGIIPVVNLDDEDTPKSQGAGVLYTPKYKGPDTEKDLQVDKKEMVYKIKGPKVNFLKELLDKYSYSSDKSSARVKQNKRDISEDLQDASQNDEGLIRRIKVITIDISDSDESDFEDEKTVVEKLPPITENMDAEVKLALRSEGTIIDAFNIPIMSKDISTLCGLNWLNDEVINFYMQMIMNRSSTNTTQWPKTYATNTFFYPRLMQQGHSALKRWTRKIDIFSFDLILIPVHLGMHWCLATIDLKSKGVFYYDSMGGDNTDCLDALLRYLQDEHMDKKKTPFDTSNFCSVVVKDIPQQMNGSDCGMFTCKFAEYLSRDAPITFSQEDMPYFRKRMIYEIVKNNLMYP